jgi:hypothetical protein
MATEITELLTYDNLPDINMTISQYDHTDCEIGRFTGTFTSIFDKIPDFEYYHYRVTALGKHTNYKRIVDNHFGVNTISFDGFFLTEENFLNSFLNHEIAVYAKQQKLGHALQYFSFAYVLLHDFWFIDRMRTLNQNTPQGFQSNLDHFLSKFEQFRKLNDLNEVKEQKGIYLLVLDKYNVCYVGQAVDIRKRIMRHWSRNDYFTGTGIDMFKAQDTTRIFVAPTENGLNQLEHQVINVIPTRYTLNCLAGGDIDYLAKNSYDLSKNLAQILILSIM